MDHGDWMRKAAEGGNAKAQFAMGQLYEQGKVVPKDPVTALKSIDLPLIFIHGTRDSVIPHANSDALHAAAPASRLWKIPDAEHIAAFAFPGQWRERLVTALDAAVR